jgi:hypothetical protein
MRQQPIEDVVERLPILVRLSVGIGKGGDLDALGLERTAKGIEVKGRDRVIGHDSRAAMPQSLCDQLPAREQPGADVYRIAALAQLYCKGLHDWRFALAGPLQLAPGESCRLVAQLVFQPMSQAAEVLAPRIDHDIGRAAVERIAFLE